MWSCSLRKLIQIIFSCARKIAKNTISFVMCVWPSVRPHGTAGLPHDEFSLNLMFENFSTIWRGKCSLLNMTSIMGTLHEEQYTFLIISRSDLLRMRTVSESTAEEIKTRISCSIIFFRKSYSLWDNVERYCTARQATDDNMAHERCMLDT
jgi:hypothetical protein